MAFPRRNEINIGDNLFGPQPQRTATEFPIYLFLWFFSRRINLKLIFIFGSCA